MGISQYLENEMWQTDVLKKEITERMKTLEKFMIREGQRESTRISDRFLFSDISVS